ncbi:hypothetical protein A1C_02420 [Rickettsia akari str. Hartford]|uniref:Uncharacterized protein n=1 Tax=Rickettsia akari (strain Hartford) TaxID=293614 RepID=A8GN08_RICAH|nr:hypothetical protein A1C_02420 [Rickettsia akari str. Hartford]
MRGAVKPTVSPSSLDHGGPKIIKILIILVFLTGSCGHATGDDVGETAPCNNATQKWHQESYNNLNNL